MINYVEGGETYARATLPSTYNGKPVTVIGDFTNWTIPNLSVPDGYIRIEPRAFNDSSIQSFYCHSHVLESIGYYAFLGCTELKNIHFNSGVSFGSRAFGDCSALICFEFPEDTQFIDSSIFENCESMEYIYIPSGVQRL
jgi:hypothetical protein